MTAMSRHDLVHALEDFLTSLIALQAHAVVVIDEAQHIQPDVLEQIRLLSNIDDERGTMLQIILVGQADLEALLARPELRQFQQRVSRRFRLEPLSADELRLYVEHRLAVGRGARRIAVPGVKELERALAEWDGITAGVTFTPDAIQAVWRLFGRASARDQPPLRPRAGSRVRAALAHHRRRVDRHGGTRDRSAGVRAGRAARRAARVGAGEPAIPAAFKAAPAAAAAARKTHVRAWPPRVGARGGGDLVWRAGPQSAR